MHDFCNHLFVEHFSLLFDLQWLSTDAPSFVVVALEIYVYISICTCLLMRKLRTQTCHTYIYIYMGRYRYTYIYVHMHVAPHEESSLNTTNIRIRSRFSVCVSSHGFRHTRTATLYRQSSLSALLVKAYFRGFC